METQYKVQINSVINGGVPDNFGWKDWVKGPYRVCLQAIMGAGGDAQKLNWATTPNEHGDYDVFRVLELGTDDEYEGFETMPDFVKDGIGVDLRVVVDPSASELHPRTMQTYMHPRAVSDLLFQFDALRKSNELKTISIENLHIRLNARNNECAEIREKLNLTIESLNKISRIHHESQTHGFDTRWACLKCQSSDVAVHVVPDGWDVKFFLDCSSCEEITMRELSLTNE